MQQIQNSLLGSFVKARYRSSSTRAADNGQKHSRLSLVLPAITVHAKQKFVLQSPPAEEPKKPAPLRPAKQWHDGSLYPELMLHNVRSEFGKIDKLELERSISHALVEKPAYIKSSSSRIFDFRIQREEFLSSLPSNASGLRRASYARGDSFVPSPQLQHQQKAIMQINSKIDAEISHLNANYAQTQRLLAQPSGSVESRYNAFLCDPRK